MFPFTKMRWTVQVPTDFPYWTMSFLMARTTPESTVLSKKRCLIHNFDWNDYSCPFNNTSWNCVGPLVCIFFSINTCPIFHLQLGGHRCRKLALSDPFLYGGFATLRFGYSQGFLEPISPRHQGTTRFGASQKLYWFSAAQEVSASNPHSVQGPTVMFKHYSISNNPEFSWTLQVLLFDDKIWFIVWNLEPILPDCCAHRMTQT